MCYTKEVAWREHQRIGRFRVEYFNRYNREWRTWESYTTITEAREGVEQARRSLHIAHHPFQTRIIETVVLDEHTYPESPEKLL